MWNLILSQDKRPLSQYFGNQPRHNEEVSRNETKEFFGETMRSAKSANRFSQIEPKFLKCNAAHLGNSRAALVVWTLHGIPAVLYLEGIVSLQRIVRTARKSLLLLLTLIALFVTFPVVSVHAQDTIDRKVKSRVSPLYPEIARKMNLAGVVKIELTVAPNGAVKETKVIGGHPILVNAAVDAVKKWKFETASADSTGTVEFRFDPNN